MLSQSKFENVYLYENNSTMPANAMPDASDNKNPFDKNTTPQSLHWVCTSCTVQVSPIWPWFIYFFPSGCLTIAGPPQQSVEPGLRFAMQI